MHVRHDYIIQMEASARTVVTVFVRQTLRSNFYNNSSPPSIRVMIFIEPNTCVGLPIIDSYASCYEDILLQATASLAEELKVVIRSGARTREQETQYHMPSTSPTSVTQHITLP
jgi:hypothetical protein